MPIALIFAVAVIFMASVALMTMTANAAVTQWDQGFETDTSDWNGSVVREASGATGITSADGDWHARVDDDGGTAFSRFGAYSSVWPGTWTAEVEVYLDTEWASGEGFDYTVAANGADGNHQRDFIFHVAKDTSTGSLIVAGSNNTNFNVREDLDTLANHEVITTSGWYTLQHVFRDNGGVLAVDLNLLDDAGNVLFTETRSAAGDTIDQIGGNRYAWFTVVNVANDLAIDNHQLVHNDAVAPDMLAPTAPVAIGATSPVVPCGGVTDSFGVTLGWTESTDNVAVTGYEYNVVTPNDTNFTTTVGTNSYTGVFNDGEGAYTYRVRAVDAAGNLSDWSNLCAVSYDNPDTPEVLGTKDECKNGGWIMDDRGFKNQGQCVSHFASNEKSTNARNR